jgi:hypothetical protein
MIRVIGSTNI